MTINWGYRIVLVFVAFVTLIAFLVVGSMKTKVDMVSEKYYADELEYQTVLDKASNTNKLPSSLQVLQDASSITVHFPVDKDEQVAGQLKFYFAADSKRDRSFNIKTDSAGFQSIGKQAFTIGNYILKIEWMANDLPYYYEQKIRVN